MSLTSSSLSRRTFLQNSSQLVAGTLLPTIESAQASTGLVAADPLRVALIGCNNMGWADLTSMLKHPAVQCVGLCDVDQNVLNRRAAELQKNNAAAGAAPKLTLYTDFRKLLDNREIDAVIVGTPDHWHCLPAVMACQAGKDVYVEKPLANSIEECNLMVAAAKKHNRIVQVGQWQRSGSHWKAAIDYVRSGKLGTVRLVKTWAYMPYGKKFPVVADEPVPAGVDYAAWLGPAPERPFNKSRFHGSFRYFWDYAGGLMTDWGAHMIDMALWGMNVTTPVSVMAAGGRFGFPDHAGETPDTLQVLFDYGQFTIQWEQAIGIGRGPYGREHGVAFIGNLGTLVTDRDGWELLPEIDGGQYLTPAMPLQRRYTNDLDRHTLNFVECVRSRQQPNAPAEVGRHVAVNAQLGNMAYRLGRKLHWDEQTQTVRNDLEANKLVRAQYRKPWALPIV
ncbi:gfo/Idh/MocA family oxidoreductase [Rudanella paleaurantiibacter]|uniref:Gfo/Idh/MocA family oxidoreductase n=1 Tax=Rudanella paleaurantiibacter TaxID=2614655 RepID=A0A7J5TZI9_9BACT|nr:Gfo/Idh/MocA family oxidoreductase [Rudanella paleaurantiibacter]KAB7730872.1 gfo/Idh/MocA family oxidoreductase [Rudanella paleaurantiibacter]